jgi:hypothetical protein
MHVLLPYSTYRAGDFNCSFEHGFYFWNYTILFAKTGQVPALLFIRETWRASIRPRQKKKWAFFLHGH